MVAQVMQGKVQAAWFQRASGQRSFARRASDSTRCLAATAGGTDKRTTVVWESVSNPASDSCDDSCVSDVLPSATILDSSRPVGRPSYFGSRHLARDGVMRRPGERGGTRCVGVLNLKLVPCPQFLMERNMEPGCTPFQNCSRSWLAHETTESSLIATTRRCPMMRLEDAVWSPHVAR